MNQEIQKQILSQLSQSFISKVILFGSQATGTSGEDSDIDLLVVTKDQNIPASFSEKMKVYNKVYWLLKDIKKQYSIDLLVYTQPLYEKFISSDSMFSREVINNGKVIYEKQDN
ncbi:MAG: nucleotidyltransferase domain-containing protein [Bacteroidales bacterium]